MANVRGLEELVLGILVVGGGCCCFWMDGMGEVRGLWFCLQNLCWLMIGGLQRIFYVVDD